MFALFINKFCYLFNEYLKINFHDLCVIINIQCQTQKHSRYWKILYKKGKEETFFSNRKIILSKKIFSFDKQDSAKLITFLK